MFEIDYCGLIHGKMTCFDLDYALKMVLMMTGAEDDADADILDPDTGMIYYTVKNGEITYKDCELA